MSPAGYAGVRVSQAPAEGGHSASGNQVSGRPLPGPCGLPSSSRPRVAAPALLVFPCQPPVVGSRPATMTGLAVPSSCGGASAARFTRAAASSTPPQVPDMALSAARFRRLALAQPHAREGSHRGAPRLPRGRQDLRLVERRWAAGSGAVRSDKSAVSGAPGSGHLPRRVGREMAGHRARQGAGKDRGNVAGRGLAAGGTEADAAREILDASSIHRVCWCGREPPGDSPQAPTT